LCQLEGYDERRDDPWRVGRDRRVNGVDAAAGDELVDRRDELGTAGNVVPLDLRETPAGSE
jgi:hypothetical protein